ncbi:unnamed protein product [Mucor hiemalis]
MYVNKLFFLTFLTVLFSFVSAGSYTYHYCAAKCGDFSEAPTYCCGHDYNYKTGKCAKVRQHSADLKYYSDKYSAWRVEDDTRNRKYFGVCCAKHKKHYCKFTNKKSGGWKTEVNYWLDAAGKVTSVVFEYMGAKK